MRNQDNPPHSYQNDEIDLFELLSALSQRKWIIVCSAVVALLLAFAYLTITPKTFESKILISEVQSANIAQLNAGQSGSQGEYTAGYAYELFQTRLQSKTLAMDYFREFVEPVYRSEGDQRGTGKLLDHFLKSITVTKPKIASDYLAISYQYKSPEMTAEWLNGYVRYVEKMTKAELVRAASLNKSLIIKKYEKEMASLRVIYTRRLEDNIILLEEAYKIAKKLNFKEAISTNALLNAQNDTPLYMKGYDVLGAEIELLKSRTLIDPFIEKIRPIQEKINYLESVRYNAETLHIVNVDGWAMTPEYSVKPRVALVLILAGMLGLICGIFVAVFCWIIERRSQV